MDEIIELRAVFSGKVQGVGFRWTVADYAEKWKLKGTVENLANGKVAVHVQGSKVDLEAFIADLQKDTGSQRIDTVSCSYHKPRITYFEFRIIH